MNIIREACFIMLTTLCLSACSGTGKFIEAPALNVAGDLTPSQAISQLFEQPQTPYDIVLCQANEQTKQCTQKDSYPKATGVGGLFLPLVLEMKAITVQTLSSTDNKLLIATTLDAPVNKIPSTCGTVDGHILFSDHHSTLKLFNSYCNWMAIGNVVQSATFSIDAIDLLSQSFTGYYKLSFYGTGNANGSGYYRAELRPSKNSRPLGE